MDNKQFGIYVLIVAAVVLVAVGFNNITGQAGREKVCTGSLKLTAIPSVGGAYFKVLSLDFNEDFRNVVEIRREGSSYRSYTTKFNECGTTCYPSTLKENNWELTTRFKLLPAGTWVASIENPCTGKKIESRFIVG